MTLATEAARRPRTYVPVLLRHPWIALLEWDGIWQCLPRAAVLHPSISDPNCRGCRATIAFEDLPNRENYRSPESIQYRLDLRYAELSAGKGKALCQRAA